MSLSRLPPPPQMMRSPPAGLLGLSLLGRARPPRAAPPVPSSQGCSSPPAPLRSQTRGPAVWSPCCSPRPNASFPVGNSIPSQTVGSIREGFGMDSVHTMLCSTLENRQGLVNTGTDGPNPLPRVPVTVKPVGGTVSLPLSGAPRFWTRSRPLLGDASGLRLTCVGHGSALCGPATVLDRAVT